MPDPALSQALKEAFASAPAGTVVLDTLEIWHPTFDEPIRVVRDHADLTARLEAGAPRDGGKRVTFAALAFEFSPPPVDTAPVPEITVTLDNVGSDITDALEGAAVSQQVLPAPGAPPRSLATLGHWGASPRRPNPAVAPPVPPGAASLAGRAG